MNSKAVPQKVVDFFAKIEPLNNYDFINHSGAIWRRNNFTMVIEWHQDTPKFMLP